MFRLIAPVLGGLLFVGLAGCQDKNHASSSDMHKNGGTMDASMHDDCPHCPGVQTADAKGNCPICGMHVVDASSSTTKPAKAPTAMPTTVPSASAQ
jgi:hypothetical protein